MAKAIVPQDLQVKPVLAAKGILFTTRVGRNQRDFYTKIASRLVWLGRLDRKVCYHTSTINRMKQRAMKAIALAGGVA